MSLGKRQGLTAAMAAAWLCLSLPSAADTGTPPTSARDLYVLNCSGCHRENGAGMPPAIPDLRRSLPRLLSSAEGRAYVLGVPGISRQLIPPEQIAEILNWSRDHLPETRIDTADFNATEVLNARQHPLTDPYRVRRQLIPEEAYGPTPKQP